MTVHAKHDVMRLSNVDPNSHLGLRIKKEDGLFSIPNKILFHKFKIHSYKLDYKKVFA